MDTAESAAKLSKRQETQKDFLRQTGLKQQFDREPVVGFDQRDMMKDAQEATGMSGMTRYRKEKSR